MRRVLFGIASAVLLAASAHAQDIRPLVDAGWLKANLNKPGMTILSARQNVSKAVFEKGHIPGAVYTDYAKGGWRAKDKNGVPSMLAPVDKLEKLIGSLGIGNATHVVIVPQGKDAADMGAATRIYWTMKVLGHDKVSILDGGWLGWSKPDPKTKKPVNPIATGGVSPKAAVFKANVRKDMLVSDDDVKTAMGNKTVLIDNRPSDFFYGIRKSPAATAAGTIPGARNVQESWLTQNGGGSFRSREQLQKIYKAVGVPTEGDAIAFCNTGHWASLGWFASSEILGNKKTRMYDGSMAAYTRRKDLPLDQKIK
ncbi:MAG: sulfurtransferase [Beijerinckiaceae bacterium]